MTIDEKIKYFGGNYDLSKKQDRKTLEYQANIILAMHNYHEQGYDKQTTDVNQIIFEKENILYGVLDNYMIGIYSPSDKQSSDYGSGADYSTDATYDGGADYSGGDGD